MILGLFKKRIKKKIKASFKEILKVFGSQINSSKIIKIRKVHLLSKTMKVINNNIKNRIS